MGLFDFLKKGNKQNPNRPDVTPTMPEARPTVTTYTVREGDTLSKIAQEHYGNAGKWEVLKKANADKVKNPDKLQAGSELIIPGKIS
jgi:nucleoid-associated protein YgaU